MTAAAIVSTASYATVFLAMFIAYKHVTGLDVAGAPARAGTLPGARALSAAPPASSSVTRASGLQGLGRPHVQHRRGQPEHGDARAIRDGGGQHVVAEVQHRVLGRFARASRALSTT